MIRISNTDVVILTLLGLSLFYAAFMLWKMAKNRVCIYLSEFKEGVMLQNPMRGRIVKKKPGFLANLFTRKKKPPVMNFYLMSDTFGRRPLNLDYDQVQPFLTITEGMPIIGIRQILRIKAVEVVDIEKTIDQRKLGVIGPEETVTFKKAVPWELPEDFDSKLGLSDYLVSWAIEDSLQDYEFCNYKSNTDFWKEVIIPMGIIVLAIILVVLLPNILSKINEMSAVHLNGALDGFKEMVKGYMPPG